MIWKRDRDRRVTVALPSRYQISQASEFVRERPRSSTIVYNRPRSSTIVHDRPRSSTIVHERP
jgi:hypothetical protein